MKKFLLLLKNLDDSNLYRLADKVEKSVRLSQVSNAAQFFQEQDPGTGLEGLTNQFLSNVVMKDSAALDYAAQGQASLDAPYRAEIDKKYEGPTILETPSPEQEAQMSPKELFDLKIRNLQKVVEEQGKKGEGISQGKFLLQRTKNDAMLQASIPTLTNTFSQLLRAQPSTEWPRIISDLKKQANTNPVLAKNITTIIQRIFKEIVRDAKISNNPKLRKDLSSNEVTKMLNEYGVQPLK